MKISNNFSHFITESSLIIVSGTQDAKFYISENGNINLLNSIKIEKPDYSDREGFFQMRARGLSVRSGSVVKSKNRMVIMPFLRSFKEELAKIARNSAVSDIFLFYPGHLARIVNFIPRTLRKKIKLEVRGNFNDSHPFDLLKKIEELYFRKKKIIPTKDDANKILGRR